MDTRQLASFCAVVDHQSFSLAAEQLGVTQPAVSLQIRSLEKRLGRRLLDRSGRRVEPTEAGLRLYQSAQRMLALEQQLVDQVAERELAAGIVGAARRHRGVSFEPLFRDEVVLACPPGHAFAGRTITLDELQAEPPVAMQEGAGVRLVIDDALRAAGLRERHPEVKLELGLQESVKSAVAAGYGITFISRSAIEAELSTGAIATARVEGLEPAREISLATATGRTMPRTAAAFLEFARGRLP